MDRASRRGVGAAVVFALLALTACTLGSAGSADAGYTPKKRKQDYTILEDAA